MKKKTVNRTHRTPLAFLLLALTFLAACTTEIQPVPVQSVSAESREGTYTAVIEGEFPDACGEIGATVQTVEGDTIRVGVLMAPPDPNMMCAQALTPFTAEVPLDTQGLEPGQYEVRVNGVPATLEIGAPMEAQPAAQPAAMPAPVASIEVEQRDDTAVVVISGEFPDACHEIGDIAQRVEDGEITVDVEMTPPDPDTMCAQVITPFSVEVPLEVRLPAGEYTVTVNERVVEVTVE